MSSHFKLSLSFLAAAGLFLLGLFWHIKNTIHTVVNTRVVTLPAKDVELITQNGNRHTITITTKKGTTTTYSRNATVEIQKDGTVRVTNHTWGLECHPVIGLGYQDTRRIYFGVNQVYFRQFDMFTVLGIPMNNRSTLLQPMTGVSWNCYSNTSIGIGLSLVNVILHEKPEIGILLSIKL